MPLVAQLPLGRAPGPARLAQPAVIDANGSEARLNCPPSAAEPAAAAWLPAPPVTVAKLLGCPATSLHTLLSNTVPVPARFEQPPVTLVKLLVVALRVPPVTLVSVPPAVLRAPPVTDEPPPDAVFDSPAAKLDPPEAMFVLPSTVAKLPVAWFLL